MAQTHVRVSHVLTVVIAAFSGAQAWVACSSCCLLHAIVDVQRYSGVRGRPAVPCLWQVHHMGLETCQKMSVKPLLP